MGKFKRLWISEAPNTTKGIYKISFRYQLDNEHQNSNILGTTESLVVGSFKTNPRGVQWDTAVANKELEEHITIGSFTEDELWALYQSLDNFFYKND